MCAILPVSGGVAACSMMIRRCCPMAKQPRTASLSADALSVFCYQLSLMMHAGIGSEEGVEVLAEDAADPGSKTLLGSLHAALLDGAPLSDALSASGAFPGYMVRMVEIGQAAGRLDQVLSALAAYYRRESETASAIRRAVLYPAVLAGAGGGGVSAAVSFSQPLPAAEGLGGGFWGGRAIQKKTLIHV